MKHCIQILNLKFSLSSHNMGHVNFTYWNISLYFCINLFCNACFINTKHNLMLCHLQIIINKFYLQCQWTSVFLRTVCPLFKIKPSHDGDMVIAITEQVWHTGQGRIWITFRNLPKGYILNTQLVVICGPKLQMIYWK